MDLCYDYGVPRTYLVCILVICSIISELKVSQMDSFPTQGTAYRVRIVTTEYSWCMSSQSSPFLKTASTCSSRVFSITTKPWPIARITCTVLHRNPPPCPALHSSWTCPIFQLVTKIPIYIPCERVPWTSSTRCGCLSMRARSRLLLPCTQTSQPNDPLPLSMGIITGMTRAALQATWMWRIARRAVPIYRD